MQVRINDVYSDSTIRSIEAKGQLLKLKLVLYNSDELVIEFDDCWAFYTEVGWNADQNIQSLHTTTLSEFFIRTIKSLEEDEESVEDLLSFQATDSYDRVTFEAVARSVRVNGQRWEPFN